MTKSFVDYFIESQHVATDLQKLIDNAGFGNPQDSVETKKQSNQTKINKNDLIYNGLRNLTQSLADSYVQVIVDLNDPERISWAGTAHELRQIVSDMLQSLAPDHNVVKQADYKHEPNTNGPTQVQRVRYILKVNKVGSKEGEVLIRLTKFDDMIAELVRGFYSRASDAAHRKKNKGETEKLLRYFEAFAVDLLNL